MKPRFSILSLFGATAYVAVAAAGLVRPLSFWNDVSYYLWLLLMLWLGIECIASQRPRLTFCLGTLFVCLVFVTMSAVADRQVAYTRWRLPQHFVAEAILKLGDFGDQIADVSDHNINVAGAADPFRRQFYLEKRKDQLPIAIHRLTNVQMSLVFGLLGGWLSVWRYRALERRQAKESAR